MSNLRRTEKIILAFATIALVSLSYLLYDDSFLFPLQNHGDLENIGSMALSQNDVRRKNIDTFSWLPASTRDSVFENDSIFTGERSEALISLQNGTQIKVAPNSLISLNLKNGQMNLNLRYGNIVGEIAKNTALIIKSGNEVLTFQNKGKSAEKSQIRFKKKNSGGIDLQLLSGKVDFIDGNRKSTSELTTSTQLSLLNTGELKKKEKPIISLITPDNFHFLKSKPDDPMPFEWSIKGTATSYKIEMSSSESFENLALIKSTINTKLEVKEPLKVGVYFWRIKAFDKDGDESAVSPVQKMELAELSAPVITTPTMDSLVNLEMKVKKSDDLAITTEIKWTAQDLLKNFIWQVAADAEFTKILQQEQTINLSAVTKKLFGGKYWVRVQGKTLNNNATNWSDAVPFTLNLTAQQEFPPAKPVLISKNIDFKVPADLKRFPSSTLAPKITWEPLPNTDKYIINISSDSRFKQMEKYTAVDSELLWSEYKPGKYYIRVYAQGKNKLLSEPSDVGTLFINIGELTLEPLKNLELIGTNPLPQTVAISWNPVAFAKKYLVQLEKGQEFTKPQQLEFNNHQGLITLPEPGDYIVRVQAVDEHNKPLTKFSNVQPVQYLTVSSLPIPMLMEPFNNASIFLQTEDEPLIWLEWKKVARAQTYTLEVSETSNFTKILFSKSLTENRFLIKEKIPLGKIYWRVKATSADRSVSSTWTHEQQFTVYHQKNESSIK